MEGFGEETDIPADEDIKQAFKEETGREPTAKELEEFKEMANNPKMEGFEEGGYPSNTEIK